MYHGDGQVAQRPRPTVRQTLIVNLDDLNKLMKPVIKKTQGLSEPHTLCLQLILVKFVTFIIPGEIREEIEPHLDGVSDAYFREAIEGCTGNTKLEAFIPLHFACDEVDLIRTFGPVEIVSTKSAFEFYRLLRSLEVIRDWIKETFSKRMGEWFELDNSHLPTRDQGNDRL